MALSGTLTGSCVANNGASSRYDYKIEWSATQNVTANTSTITATAYVRSNNSSYSTSTNWTSIINGTTVKTFSYYIQASAGWVNFGSKTWTVNHNADGTCTTSITGSFSGTYNGSYVLRSGSVSGNITLNTIPRASSFSLNRTSATIGTDTIKVNISRASSSFTHTVIYKFGSISAEQATRTTATSVSFTPVLSDCSQIPNATSGTATIVVDTYSGSTKIGTASKTITLNVPSSVVPSIGSVTATGNNLLGSVYVAGKSTVTAKINSASGSQGSTIKSYHLSGAGLNNASSSATSGTLSAGTHTITGKVTDSRGRTASKSVNITVHSYASPTLSASVYRCNSGGTATDDGTYVRASISVNIDNVGNANVNAKQYKIEWKQSSGSTWSTLKDWTVVDKYSTSWIHDLGGNWANTTSYDVRISLKDSYNTVSVTRTVGTIACVLNVEQNGVGVGKIHERGALDVGGTIYMNGQTVLTSNHPTSGNWFRGVPAIGSDGVMEVGKYIDFHNSNTTTADYTARLTDNNGTIESSGNFKANGALYVQGARVGVVAGHGGLDIGHSERATAICSGTQPTWWNGSVSRQLVYSENDSSGYPAIISNSGNSWIRTPSSGLIPNTSGTGSGRSNIGSDSWRFSTGYFNNVEATSVVYAGRSGSDFGGGFVARRYLNNKQQSAKCMIINTGGGCASILHRDETNSWEVQFLVQAWSAGTGCVRPNNSGGIENGTSAYKWKVVYASNGTVQTSDERFKVKRGLVDTEDCFDMVKNTDLFKYVMLDQDKTTLSKTRLGKMALENEGDDVKLQMGVIAQDLQKYKCGKHILVEGEFERADGTMDTMLHINPYNFTTAIMGALKEEIRLREESDADKEQRIEKLEQEIEVLKSMIKVGT